MFVLFVIDSGRFLNTLLEGLRISSGTYIAWRKVDIDLQMFSEAIGTYCLTSVALELLLKTDGLSWLC